MMRLADQGRESKIRAKPREAAAAENVFHHKVENTTGISPTWIYGAECTRLGDRHCSVADQKRAGLFWG